MELNNYSLDDFKRNVIIKGFTHDANEIKWFWIAVENLNDAERAKLLQFITGSSQVPLGGFAELQIKIARRHAR